MNISNVSSSQFVSLDSESSSGNYVTSMSGELALLVLESQEQRKEMAREQLESARHDFSEALVNEVAALHEQADAAFRGALVSAGTSAAGSGMQLWGLGREKDNAWQSKVGEGLNKLSEPIGGMASKTYGAADAKSVQGAEEAARWQIDDSRDQLDSAKQLQNKALDWASAMLDRDAATTAAILANKV